MLRNAALIGIVAVGMTYLLIAGEIDLSVGSVFGFLNVIMGLLVVVVGLNPWLAMVLVTALGALTGAINGLIRTRIGIPSFIVTLAMLVAYRSGALIASGERPLTTRGRTPFYELTGGELFGTIPWHVVWMVAIMAIGGLVLARTRFGSHLYATGGNLEAARFAGINTDRVKLAAFILTGALCGLIGALLFGYLRVAEPTTGTGFEFRVIGAVIVGGVALTGGRGTIYGSLIGALIISMITSGLVLLGFSQDVGDIATGVADHRRRHARSGRAPRHGGAAAGHPGLSSVSRESGPRAGPLHADLEREQAARQRLVRELRLGAVEAGGGHVEDIEARAHRTPRRSAARPAARWCASADPRGS